MKSMRKKILYSELNSVGDVLDNVFKDININAGMKKSTFYKFWSKIVGKKFESVSKPADIRNGVLVVACANSHVTSELTLFKQDIIKKAETYAKPLGIEISDINFSHKIWKEEETREPDAVMPSAKNFNPDEIELDEDEIIAVKKSVESNTFASEEQRERMFNAIILDLKYQKFIKK
jgi:hypothetical protein